MSAQLSAEVKMEGVKELVATLRKIGAHVSGKVSEEAVTAGAEIVRSASANAAPIRTGVLRSSLSTKVKTYRKSQTVWGGVGPDNDRKEYRSEYKRMHRPTNIAHLLEFGHRIVNTIARPKRAVPDAVRRAVRIWDTRYRNFKSGRSVRALTILNRYMDRFSAKRRGTTRFNPSRDRVAGKHFMSAALSSSASAAQAAVAATLTAGIQEAAKQ